MANENYNTNATNQQNQYLPNFVQELNGDYVISKPLNKSEIVDLAKYVIANQFQKGKQIANTACCKNYLLLHLAKYENEIFCALFLNNKNQVIAFEQLFTGTINEAPVYPREVMKKALQYNAAAIIFAHNHLSGSTEPSMCDIAITKKLKESLAIVDVRVLDHIIISGNQAFSFSDAGLLC